MRGGQNGRDLVGVERTRATSLVSARGSLTFKPLGRLVPLSVDIIDITAELVVFALGVKYAAAESPAL